MYCKPSFADYQEAKICQYQNPHTKGQTFAFIYNQSTYLNWWLDKIWQFSP